MMLPLRRYGTFASRIAVVLALLLISLFIVNGFTKYLRTANNRHFSRNGNAFLDNHHFEHHHDQKRPQIVTAETVRVNAEPEKQIPNLKDTNGALGDVPPKLQPATIANKPISIYVHFDLKGAPPKVSYFEQLFPLLRRWGAHGVCMEYEDMFPFDGIVSNVKHKHAYTKDDIQRINKIAGANNLNVMPLLQTYGHLEFVLKLKEFSDLRENAKYPQVITPCVNKTYAVLFSMIDQYLELHPDIRLLHIGHDEVYYFLTHPACQNLKASGGTLNYHDVFARHLSLVANYIRKKNSKISLFIWHDVLQNINYEILQHYNVLSLVNPVLWSYREDVSVEGFIVGPQSTLFGQFKSMWAASAFKGATGEIATISDVKRHYENQVSWIQQLNLYIPTRWKNFDGVMLTGWSRYDHFLSLCELLPYSIPSMAYSLAAWNESFKSLPKTDIYLNKQLQDYIEKELQCSSHIHLNIHEHSSKPVPKCKFPGANVYEAIISLSSIWYQVEQVESFVEKYVTDLHVKYRYIHVKRGEECLEKLAPVMSILNHFIESFTKSMDEVFPADVAIEWLETYFMKRYRSVNERYQFIRHAVQEQTSWLPRPIPDIDKLQTDQKQSR